MPVMFQKGQINPDSLRVPDLYIINEQPQAVVSSVASGRFGMVGTASWGPLNTPFPVYDISSFNSAFGYRNNTLSDLGRALSRAIELGVNDFRLVRVSDGTDKAASASVPAKDDGSSTGSGSQSSGGSATSGDSGSTQQPSTVSGGATVIAASQADSGVLVSGLYTGITGNSISIKVEKTYPYNDEDKTFTVSVISVVLGLRTYNGQTWKDIQTQLKADPAATVVVSGDSLDIPLYAVTFPLSGGSDGGTVAPQQLLGSDGAPPTGIYTLRNQNIQVLCVPGLTDVTLFSRAQVFCAAEAMTGFFSTPPGDTVASFTKALATNGIGNTQTGAWSVVYLGDYLYYNDSDFGIMLESPALLGASKAAANAPNQSTLNKQITGVIGSQRSGLNGTGIPYSQGELTSIFAAGGSVIGAPSPGGNYYSDLGGFNSSTNLAENDVSYSRMTNYIAQTLKAGMGVYVGSPTSTDLLGAIRASLLDVYATILNNGWLALQEDGSVPYQVICDSSNNPQAQTGRGIVKAQCRCRYMGINKFFVVEMTGGSTITVTTANAA